MLAKLDRSLSCSWFSEFLFGAMDELRQPFCPRFSPAARPSICSRFRLRPRGPWPFVFMLPVARLSAIFFPSGHSTIGVDVLTYAADRLANDEEPISSSRISGFFDLTMIDYEVIRIGKLGA